MDFSLKINQKDFCLNSSKKILKFFAISFMKGVRKFLKFQILMYFKNSS